MVYLWLIPSYSGSHYSPMNQNKVKFTISVFLDHQLSFHNATTDKNHEKRLIQKYLCTFGFPKIFWPGTHPPNDMVSEPKVLPPPEPNKNYDTFNTAVFACVHSLRQTNRIILIIKILVELRRTEFWHMTLWKKMWKKMKNRQENDTNVTFHW